MSFKKLKRELTSIVAEINIAHDINLRMQQIKMNELHILIDDKKRSTHTFYISVDGKGKCIYRTPEKKQTFITEELVKDFKNWTQKFY